MASRSLVQEIIKIHEPPFYVYDLDILETRARDLKRAVGSAEIHYAMKANGNPWILSSLAALGFGADVVSEGEMQIARRAGIAARNIVFSGVAKSREEISRSLRAGVGQINVESLPELARLESVARDIGVKPGAKPKVTLRVNPDVNPVTHPYITTGFRDNKFGMDLTEMTELVPRLLRECPSLDIVGFDLHIGSQLLELDSLRESLTRTRKVFEDLQRAGVPFSVLDVGGGLGIPYRDEDVEISFDKYAAVVTSALAGLKVQVMMEPGRSLVGPAGVLVARVEYVKKTKHKNFLIVNTGMHHLIRPALYQAYHRIELLGGDGAAAPAAPQASDTYDIVGPICESSDVLGRDRYLPSVKEGDLIFIRDAGAYGSSMSSRYNGYPAVQEMIVRGDRWIACGRANDF